MNKKFRIYNNAPITIGFVMICLMVLFINYLTHDYTNITFFSTYGSSWLNPMTYLRLIGHVFGHSSMSHLMSNMLYILLLGPILEEKYHDKLVIVIFTTAVVTGMVHNFLQPNTILLGASGVVFSFILLSSVTGRENGIPVTLILVAILYLGQEIYNGLLMADNISQITHIIGGLSGALLGMTFKNQ